ncbi:hypothetical protein ACFWGI_06640 [Streptomyces niveus]|uniref:hypothetical protein n=1 Tax=Streptomyces niveus TaxID=193462 RepID=UPI00365123B8
MNASADIVRLRNGGDAPRVVVQTTLITLQKFETDYPDTLRSLALLAANPGHDVPAEDILRMVSYAMADSTQALHKIVRDIVLSAVEIEGDKVRLVPPALR